MTGSGRETSSEPHTTTCRKRDVFTHDSHHCELLPDTPSFKPWPAYWKTQAPRFLRPELEATQTRLVLQTLRSPGRFGVLVVYAQGKRVIILLSGFSALVLAHFFPVL